MSVSDERIRLLEQATADLVAAAAAVRDDDDRTTFEARVDLARMLGAAFDPDTGLTTFGFWAPELTEGRVPEGSVVLELFEPRGDLDLTVERQVATFTRHSLHLVRAGDYWWGVVDGITAGSNRRTGTFYWMRATGLDGSDTIVRDLVAHSIPFGSFAPAEVYDMVGLQRRRRDLDHFATTPSAPTSILELHIPTATAGGTVANLTETYRRIGERLRQGEPLTPAEQVYIDYDAIQPLPVDPTIERPKPMPTFSVVDEIDEVSGLVSVLLRQPENQNWGYDNMVASSSAANPSLLRTKRPDELVALAEALHDLPRPMMLIYDLVYGHADNQALDVLPSRFFKGPNMYGQDLNHQDPTVRAILLEMQRRRIDTGCDGLRIDGAQDFKFYDPRTGQVGYDDDYLQSMSDVEQTIGPHRRKVWMIFEDGRPWPQEGWETSSTYRDVIEKQPETYQWGPLIFAHNTPMLDGFWSDKWWRVEEIVEHGGNWISGCANHDTVRRGTQVDPAKPLNHHLGPDLPTILDNAYDNAAVSAVSYGLLPGIPMDFINATTRTPWGFMRTTDDIYGPKVMAEEGGFLDWQLTDAEYEQADVMARTKRHGFATRTGLRRFLAELEGLIETTEYRLEEIAVELAGPDELRPGPHGLALLATDFMLDVHELCNVGRNLPTLDAARVDFAAGLRTLRRENPWLRSDCGPLDEVTMKAADQIVYRGHRVSPDQNTVIATVANMAGPSADADLDDIDWPEGLGGSGWSMVERFTPPAAEVNRARASLPDGTGIVSVWRTSA